MWGDFGRNILPYIKFRSIIYFQFLGFLATISLDDFFYFFKNWQNWANSRYKKAFFPDFTIFHNFTNCERLENQIVLCCEIVTLFKNRIVLCCEIVFFHKHKITISQKHNFTILFYNSGNNVNYRGIKSYRIIKHPQIPVDLHNIIGPTTWYDLYRINYTV